jgi:branched-chain amino acid transport system substrate-binding protein
MKKMAIVKMATMLVLAGCGGADDGASDGLPRGVTADSIKVGSHTDLSGNLAIWGVPATNGQRMRFDEANAAGGIHGRMIDFIVEDSQYQMPNAVKATNKLRDQARAGMAYMVEKHKIKSVCLQAQANDYGAEVEVGFHQAVEELGLDIAYVGRHKRAEIDFTGTVTAIKNSGCELLVLGPFVTDTILLYSAARDAGWDAPIIGNMVSYVPEVAQASDSRTEGLFTVASFYMPPFKSAEPGSWIADWYARYLELFDEEPAAQSIIGYVIADLTVRALETAGPDLTTEKLLAAIETIRNYEDPFGGPSLTFSPDKHQGGDYLYLYEVVNSQWQVAEEKIPF